LRAKYLALGSKSRAPQFCNIQEFCVYLMLSGCTVCPYRHAQCGEREFPYTSGCGFSSVGTFSTFSIGLVGTLKEVRRDLGLLTTYCAIVSFLVLCK
jgi:hypothetical protein